MKMYGFDTFRKRVKAATGETIRVAVGSDYVLMHARTLKQALEPMPRDAMGTIEITGPFKAPRMANYPARAFTKGLEITYTSARYGIKSRFRIGEGAILPTSDERGGIGVVSP